MVTPQEVRLFALECLRWAEETDNASHRDLMLNVAKTWMGIAATLERKIEDGGEIFPDLRPKLD
jgi:hypothetical protein